LTALAVTRPIQRPPILTASAVTWLYQAKSKAYSGTPELAPYCYKPALAPYCHNIIEFWASNVKTKDKAKPRANQSPGHMRFQSPGHKSQTFGHSKANLSAVQRPNPKAYSGTPELAPYCHKSSASISLASILLATLLAFTNQFNLST